MSLDCKRNYHDKFYEISWTLKLSGHGALTENGFLEIEQTNIGYNFLLLFLIQSESTRGDRICSDDSDDIHCTYLNFNKKCKKNKTQCAVCYNKRNNSTGNGNN